jgi:ankyrin repeat protein
MHISLQNKKNIQKTANKHFKQNSVPEFLSAVKEHNYQAVQDMIDAGTSIASIDPNDNNKMAIHLACENGDIEMVKLLEKNGADLESLDFEQMTPIYYAIKSEKIDMIEYLLSKKVYLEHKEFQDRTPFYCACSICTPATIEYLY